MDDLDDLEKMKGILRDTLQIGARVDDMNDQSRLFGSIPEFDSVAVVGVVTSIEYEYRIKITDEELSADVFETLGSLRRFIASKTDVLRSDA
jgi:acyl carrier protein